MAIGTTPLFSKISGSAGPVDFRTRRNGKIEIGKKRIPANPQSTEQQNTRNAYGRLHELWQNAAWIDKTQYENIATAYDISPWNAFLMRHLSTMRLNPAAYWPFVEGTGNTLHDFTTNEYHGTISGAVWERFGKYDIPSLLFDGIDDFVDCGSIPQAQSPTGTISGWVKPTKIGEGQCFQLNPPSTSNYMRSYINPNNLVDMVIEDNNLIKIQIVTQNPLIKDEWVNIALSQDGLKARIHLNGIDQTVTEYTQSGDWWTNHLLFFTAWLGRGSWGYIKGYMNQAAVLNTGYSTNITKTYNTSKQFYEVYP